MIVELKDTNVEEEIEMPAQLQASVEGSRRVEFRVQQKKGRWGKENRRLDKEKGKVLWEKIARREEEWTRMDEERRKKEHTSNAHMMKEKERGENEAKYEISSARKKTVSAKHWKTKERRLSP